MGIERPAILGTPELVAEMREIIADTRKSIEASQEILDRCAAPALDLPPVCAADDLDLLGGVADGLIVAYAYAKRDGDALTLALIEKAMIHVGRRLAHAVGPKEAGLVCH